MSEVRVRIAPSPSGNLHIGTARTALFNYLFAKKNNGKFILRIEDTDALRTQQAYVDNIFDSLKALGLNWDEGPDIGGPYGPYTQSKRFDIYPKYIQTLLDKGFAYECFCTPEELEAEKEEAAKNKKAYVYTRKCVNLTEEEKEKLRAEGRKPAIRFNVQKAQAAFHDSSILSFEDLVKGHLHMDTNLIGDFVIMKSNGAPTYNYAVVIDDALMHITHVIRGEDHISNTYKQILIYEALGFEVPKFGHLGMILAPDRSKLSKRHGATAVSDFVKEGYLTEALVNFVALLGWSPSDGQEIKSIDEIAKDFRIEDLSSSNSIFEYDKLKWMNSHYIKMLPIEDLKERLKPYLTMYPLDELTDAQYTKMVEITREPLTLLSDITDAVPYFFGKDVKIEPDAQAKTLDTEVSQSVLKDFVSKAQDWEWTEENLEEKLAQFRADWKANEGIKPKVTMWAIRAAVTGRTCGADMVGILEILGKDTSLYRAKKAIK
ncbi:MAG TPA: glutamate--tRNA ligase [Cyanobacteria bacterium UBA11991]|nr:glutamate--tRNA ligase [Cyanobacteriota bacterium]MDY6357942.1 glutamate--tRNA ligase [Cyanobacteriota bacterium]MDY6363730.1 glutamate--tRNA ligase [Cyanobacteriota bacterium]MDY6382772.1 glutamate--tRNA ligase [Cyanobacteriota bacterium]HCB10778.1 glutamate--tRNA ligase [Cyanobacteria bacterium UBA11991]